MMIFLKARPDGQIIAFPLNQVLMVKQEENIIFIKISTGEVDVDGDDYSNAVSMPRVEEYIVEYSSEQAAVAEMQVFFKVCSSNQGAFFFMAE